MNQSARDSHLAVETTGKRHLRVMIFGANYEPDLGPSAPLFTMLCQNLVRLGHQVTIITMVPHYPSGKVAPEFRGRARWLLKSVENGVNVVRVGLPSVDRSRLFQRLWQFFCYQVGAAWAGMSQKYDVALACTSSLTAWLPFATMVVLRRKPAIYSVYDVYPGVGITLGIFRNKAVIALVSSMERFCLSHAKIVRIISNAFRPELRSMGVPDEKMALLYDWVDTDLIQPLPKVNPFSTKFNLSDKFVVLYAGNMGLSQGLEHVLAAARLLSDDPEIRIVFVGEGTNRVHLMDEAEKQQLRNVEFIAYQPRECLPDVLATADISLVSLQRGIGSNSLPSKTYSILASGRPILAIMEEKGDCWNLIREAEAGVRVPSEDPLAIAEAVRFLKKDKDVRDRMGQKGREWALKFHSPQAGASGMEKLLLQIVQGG